MCFCSCSISTSVATATNSTTCWHYVLSNGLWQYIHEINKEEHEKKQFISRRQTSISGQLINVLNSNKAWRHKFASRELQDLTANVRNIWTLWQAIVFVFMGTIIEATVIKRIRYDTCFIDILFWKVIFVPSIFVSHKMASLAINSINQSFYKSFRFRLFLAIFFFISPKQ